MTLHEQQRALAAAIVGGALPAGLLHAPARLSIYRHAHLARLGEALDANYPVLHRVLGDDAFGALVAAYAQACPSRHPSIRWFGDRLPAWLRERPDLAPHPALADLAAMEWALRAAFDAADAEPLTAGDLATLVPEAWPGLSFSAHPSLALLTLAWAVEPLWHAAADDDAGDAPAGAAPPAARPHTLLVWRQGLQTRWRTLDDDEAPLLAACIAGEPFSALCTQAESLSADAAQRVAGLLRLWLGAGLLLWPEGPPSPLAAAGQRC